MKLPLYDDQDGFIGSLAKDHLADADLRPEAADRLRRKLDLGFARQRVRHRRISATITASIIVLISLTAYQTDVISTALDIVFEKINSLSEPTFVSVSTEDRYGSPLDSTATLEEHRLFVEKAHELRMAGEWKVNNIWGWTLRGSTSYAITYDVEIDAIIYNYYDIWPEEGLSETAISDREAFYAGPQNDMIADIQAGTAQTLPAESVAILGQLYEFDKYAATYPGWGEVVVWIAIPSD
ncbi:MAG: hypothetical protein GY838_03415 [bacterium]|nr:hypothetical protein [bacterium]